MRKVLLLLMLATTAATPALAQDRNDGERRSGFGERLREARDQARSQKADRPVRAERAERAERPVQVERAERPVRVERQQAVRSVEQRGELADQMQRSVRIERQRQLQRSGQQVTAPAHSQSTDGFRNRLRDRVRQVDRSGDGVTVLNPGTTSPRVITTQRRDGRDGDRRWRDGDRRYDNHWRDGWRRDSRYDWRRYRDRNRSLFRFGSYYDPFGYSYRPFSIGWPIRSSYWGSNYWIQDPWMYRLPPAYGPYRWVRYWDDALLVDMRTGRVVDVVHNFFW